MSVFEYILAPFVFVLEQIYLLSYALTGDYGVSIVLLSFVVSLVLLPVFVFIEKAKKKDDAVKRTMLPFVKEIKRCYKGQERHYYLKTLNRQYNYNPIRSLIPTLSLLLQIPFFIAAYQFLEGFAPLSGVSFLFINDLNAPDGVFGSVNLLPIAMTVVNLVTAYFYTRNGNIAELKQMVVVAALFLVLLFNLPAGLVLYWTMNNVFSFFRLFITNPEAFKKPEKKAVFKKIIGQIKSRLTPIIPALKNTFFLILLVGVIIQINGLLNGEFQSALSGVINVLIFSVGIPFVIAVLSITHKINTDIKGIRGKGLFLALWPTYKPMFIVLFVAAAASQLSWAYLHGYHSIVQRLFLVFIASSFVTSILALLILFYQGHVVLSLSAYQLKFSTIAKKNKTQFYLLLALLFSLFLLSAMFFGFQDMFLKLIAAIVFSWVFVMVLVNRSLLFSQISTRLLNLLYSATFIKSLLFLSVYFLISALFYYSGYNRVLGYISVALIAIAQLLGFLYPRLRSKQYAIPVKYNTLLFVVVFVIQLLFFLISEKIILKSIGWHSEGCLLLAFVLGFAYGVLLLNNLVRVSFSETIFSIKGARTLYVLSLFYVLGLVFFWSPLMVYASFPETFSFPPALIFVKNIPFFAGAFSVLFILYLLLPKKSRFFLVASAVLLVLVFFFNSFIIPIKVGTLQLGKYMKAAEMAKGIDLYFVEGGVLLALYYGVVWCLKRYSKQLKIGIVALTLILVTQSLSTSLRKSKFFTKDDALREMPNNISFSTQEQNVVYVLADAFLGIHIDSVLNDTSTLMDVYEGFVWYPNTVSVSTNTAPSISSLLAGSEFNIDKLNEDESRTVAEKITAVTESFTHKVKEKGYRFTSTRMVYSAMNKKKYDAYLPTWHSDWNKWTDTLSIGGAKELDFAILWKNAAFYGAPLFVKPKIYRNGDWIKIEAETNKNTTASKDGNLIRVLPFISDTNSAKGSFVYIHSGATHPPFRIVNDNGELVNDVSSYHNNKWFLIQFAKWIKWMKENRVYDNTKIIVVSDHGHALPDNVLENYGGKYRWKEDGHQKLSIKDFWSVNALLMVKDYKSCEAFTADWRFMSNSDAYAIAFDENDPRKLEVETRTLPVFLVGNQPRSTYKKVLPPFKQFVVTDSLYNPNNWLQVE